MSGQAVAADNNLHLQECQLVNRLGLALVFLFLCLLIWFYLKVCSCLLLPSLDHQVLHGLADLYPPPCPWWSWTTSSGMSCMPCCLKTESLLCFLLNCSWPNGANFLPLCITAPFPQKTSDLSFLKTFSGLQSATNTFFFLFQLKFWVFPHLYRVLRILREEIVHFIKMTCFRLITCHGWCCLNLQVPVKPPHFLPSLLAASCTGPNSFHAVITLQK